MHPKTAAGILKNHFCAALLACLLISVLSARASAKIVTTPVDYQHAGVALQGWISYDDSVKDARPGIVIFPEWWGLTDYPKHRAEQLAALGYVAFAADMYGKGVTTDDAAEAGKLSKKFYDDPSLMRGRAQAGLEALKKDSHVDGKKLAAIGYCFGGSCALELARGGADLLAVVTFHGNLSTTTPQDAKNIKGKILVCAGGDDAFVPPSQIEAFEDEMRKANVDWTVIVYGGAHHAFTNPDADKHAIPNIAYDAKADRRSWVAMKLMFEGVFGKAND